VAEGVGSPVAPAELTWALIMAAMRRLPQYISNLKHGAWQQSGLKAASMPPNFGVGMVLRGKTLGIWGYGRIGQMVAGYGKAFGMQVLIWGSEARCAKARADGHWPAPKPRAVLRRERRAEPAPAAERRNARHRRPGGPVAHEAHGAVRQHLARRAGGAGRADRGAEPRPPRHGRGRRVRERTILQGHALLRLENCICTPHIGYVEQDSYELYFGAAFDNVVNFIKGQPTNIVNPGALQVPR
jgi:D-3-phosphoglycerate dehydrogenase